MTENEPHVSLQAGTVLHPSSFRQIIQSFLLVKDMIYIYIYLYDLNFKSQLFSWYLDVSLGFPPLSSQELVALWPEGLDGCVSNFAFRRESTSVLRPADTPEI